MLEGLKKLDGHSEVAVQMALAEVASCASGDKTLYKPLLDAMEPMLVSLRVSQDKSVAARALVAEAKIAMQTKQEGEYEDSQLKHLVQATRGFLLHPDNPVSE